MHTSHPPQASQPQLHVPVQVSIMLCDKIFPGETQYTHLLYTLDKEPLTDQSMDTTKV